MKTLHDGREVASDSDEWRHECQCIAILRLSPLDVRRDCLAQLEKKYGKPYVDRVKETMKQMWEKRRCHVRT
jgi:hypothetical protein